MNNQIKHLAIIPDGCRRWAKLNHTPLNESYLLMVQKIYTLIDLCFSKNIMEISVYFASIDNFQRTPEEVNAFCEAEIYFFENLLPLLNSKYNPNVKVSGNMEKVPKTYRNVIRDAVTHEKNRPFSLNFAIAYCPFYEIEEALTRGGGAKKFTIKLLKINTPVDLLLRTGGENCISKFLPLQSSYARIYFSNEFINNFTINEFEDYLNHYYLTKRKFGR